MAGVASEETKTALFTDFEEPFGASAAGLEHPSGLTRDTYGALAARAEVGAPCPSTYLLLVRSGRGRVPDDGKWRALRDSEAFGRCIAPKFA